MADALRNLYDNARDKLSEFSRDKMSEFSMTKSDAAYRVFYSWVLPEMHKTGQIAELENLLCRTCSLKTVCVSDILRPLFILYEGKDLNGCPINSQLSAV